MFLYYSEVVGVKGNFSYQASDERDTDRLLRETRLAERGYRGRDAGENSD